MMKQRMTSERPNPRRRVTPSITPVEGVEPYAFAQSTLVGPNIPGANEVVAMGSIDELIDLVAADLVVHAENCVRQFGDFHMALSGGSTPAPLYERLMYDPDYRRLPWRRTHLWIVDERCVPFDDPRSNFRMINETIVDHADIPQEQVHPIFAMSATGDVEYETSLRETLAWREKGQDRLDYILLGMGADGHTASLFPHSPALQETARLMRMNISPEAAPHERLTMTFPLINASRFVAVLVTGKSKAAMIQRLCSGDDPVDELPIKGVAPLNGELKWYLDAQACGIDVAGE